ncbi:MAG TPA: hypothetical protein VJT78_12045 [Candidatus Dormibacteraeota bacterium]|nr:hypothetical protein [Candidatus Dormibacteraeota bacterium]
MSKNKRAPGPERRRPLPEVNLAPGAKPGAGARKRGCLPFFGLLVVVLAAGITVSTLVR